MYDLARMVYADKIKSTEEEVLLRKIALGLGFHSENVKYIIDKALTLVDADVDLEAFKEAIKNMNR